MEDLVESLARGNVSEVKTVLTWGIATLAVYQLVLIAIGYGRVRVPFLAWGPATRAHRLVGDVILVLTAVVGFACLAMFGFDDDGGTHAISGVALGIALGLKVLSVRLSGAHGRVLPLLGGAIFVLLAITWGASAATHLGSDD